MDKMTIKPCLSLETFPDPEDTELFLLKVSPAFGNIKNKTSDKHEVLIPSADFNQQKIYIKHKSPTNRGGSGRGPMGAGVPVGLALILKTQYQTKFFFIEIDLI